MLIYVFPIYIGSLHARSQTRIWLNFKMTILNNTYYIILFDLSNAFNVHISLINGFNVFHQTASLDDYLT